MFLFLCANQHHCHMIDVLCDNWSASFYQSLMDAERRRALVCLDLLKSRAAELSISINNSVAHLSPITTASPQCWMKGRKVWCLWDPGAESSCEGGAGAFYPHPHSRFLRRDWLSSVLVRCYSFVNMCQYWQCHVSERATRITKAAVEMKYSTAGSSHSIKVPSEAELVLTLFC